MLYQKFFFVIYFLIKKRTPEISDMVHRVSVMYAYNIVVIVTIKSVQVSVRAAMELIA